MNDDVRYYGNPMNWESTKGDIISREALKKEIVKLCEHINANNGITVPTLAFTRIIDNAPAVEYTFEETFQKTVCENRLYCPARPQGEWKDVGTTIEGIPIYSCSICHREIYTYSLVGFPFCHCGADMRGEEE